MWKYVVALIATIAIVFLVLSARAIPSDARVCRQLATLCEGEPGDVADCERDLPKAKETLGASWKNVANCADDAKSCPEILGCFVGGAGNALKRVSEDFERGADKAFGKGPSQHRNYGRPERSNATCDTFHATGSTATWTGCQDQATREVSCEDSVTQKVCRCLVDGVSKGFFFATRPPLDDRTSAGRVARANCGSEYFEGL